MKPAEEPKELVIPLITRNVWQSKNAHQDDDSRQKRSAEGSDKSEPPGKKKKDETKVEPSDLLESEAVKEIMKGE